MKETNWQVNWLQRVQNTLVHCMMCNDKIELAVFTRDHKFSPRIQNNSADHPPIKIIRMLFGPIQDFPFIDLNCDENQFEN